MNKKIIIATINSKKLNYSITADEFSALGPNIQMGLLVSYLKSKGLEVEMIESDVEGLSHDDLIDRVESQDPALFGVIVSGANPSSSTMTMAGVVEFYERYMQRKSKVKNFIWGAHPTVLPERSLRETGADFIVRNEGYNTIIDLYNTVLENGDIGKVQGISYLKGGSTKFNGTYIATPSHPLVKDLNALPMMDWEAMNPAKYRAHNWHAFDDIENRGPYAIIWTSFGCPFPCNYCCINNLFEKRTQRFRTIDNVIAEISLLVEKYHVRHLKILDELFVTNQKRMDEFCDKLEVKGYDLNMWAYSRVDTINRHILKRLKKVGVNWVSYGFENPSPDILVKIEKKNRQPDVDSVIKMSQDEGLAICADVMFGLWDEDYDSMNRTYDFLVKYNFEWANMNPVMAYPGTVLYEKVEEPKDWRGYSLYGYECVPCPTKYLTAQQVLRYRDEAFVRYHSRPEYLSMIEKKFGMATKNHILRMLKTPLKRRILVEEDQRSVVHK